MALLRARNGTVNSAHQGWRTKQLLLLVQVQIV